MAKRQPRSRETPESSVLRSQALTAPPEEAKDLLYLAEQLESLNVQFPADAEE